MNEELQKQLVETLKELRAGATPAFEMLVSEYGAYCWARAALAVVVIVVMALLAWRISRVKELQMDEDALAILLIGSVAVGIVGTTFAMVNLFQWLPRACAPLGGLIAGIHG